MAKFPKNEECKDARNKTDVAQKGISNWNPVDKDGRVHDRWHHSCNPTRLSWLGEDGLSYWEGSYDKSGRWIERQVFRCDVTDENGIRTLVFFAVNHAEQDNLYLNEKRLVDFAYQNAVEAFESNPSEGEVHPEESLVDPDQPSVHEQAFPEQKEPTTREILTRKWHDAISHETNEDWLAMYRKVYQDGIALQKLIDEESIITGKSVKSQTLSYRMSKVIERAYVRITGDVPPKRRKRKPSV